MARLPRPRYHTRPADAPEERDGDDRRIASLSLALGACLTAFSLIEALILRPLPVTRPDSLVSLSFPTYNAERPEGDTLTTRSTSGSVTKGATALTSSP